MEDEKEDQTEEEQRPLYHIFVESHLFFDLY